MEILRIGILGAGHIAHKMASAVAQLQEAEIKAVGSRSQEKADAFASQYGIQRAYGSYEALVSDPDIDLIYVATPHSHHFRHARLAMEHNKAVLVEKAFCLNARETEELINLSRQRGIFLAEAIWTRYMPMSQRIKEVMESGIIGEPRLLTATLCYNIEHKERVIRPELGGGALLDVGVYVLNFARMCFGSDIERTVSNVHLNENGVDMMECISLTYKDGKMANLQAGGLCFNDRFGIISGTEGHIRVHNVNCPERIEVFRGFDLVQTIERPADMINGFEYQVRECKRCLEHGFLESPLMPHSEILSVMRQMDALRQQWGVRFPQD